MKVLSNDVLLLCVGWVSDSRLARPYRTANGKSIVDGGCCSLRSGSYFDSTGSGDYTSEVLAGMPSSARREVSDMERLTVMVELSYLQWVTLT